MNTTNIQIINHPTLILKTGIFNDEESVDNSLLVETTDDVPIVDISMAYNADFTDTDWDSILNSILSSSKVITV